MFCIWSSYVYYVFCSVLAAKSIIIKFDILGIRSYFDDELEEEDEYELTPAQRRQFSIPSHVEKVNEGILRKYGVPSQEAKRLEKRLRSSGKISIEFF